ncbi:MAG: ABC transporter permease [Bacteroidota bacterium]|nr:ABC transporter permease [Bacteroidota bacterium]
MATIWNDEFKEGLMAFLNTLAALLFSLALFALFLLVIGANPLEVFGYMVEGSVGSSFSVQNTILMSSPLLLVAFCTALPAKLGMVVIGGEGALVVGGLAAAVAGVSLSSASYFVTMIGMFVAAFTVGGLWITIIGYLKHYKGANETIVGLLLNYIAIACMNHLVEGSLRDPASLNKPSTYHIGPDKMLGTVGGSDIHYGVIMGIILALLMYFLYHFTTFGFSVRIIGGNKKAAKLAGLSIEKVILLTFFLAGGIAGLAGMVEVAAVHGRANASLVAGYGYTGILVSFLARHNPLAIIPVTFLFGALTASNGLIQRRCELPDATMIVLQGIIFVTIIGWEPIVAMLKIKLPKTS